MLSLKHRMLCSKSGSVMRAVCYGKQALCCSCRRVCYTSSPPGMVTPA
jgi:hypothetical protein